MTFEYYISQGADRLRCGYTTGTCAALAAQAAVTLLLTGVAPASASIRTPTGILVQAPVQKPALHGHTATCAIQKDAGDDPDVTAGALVFASVQKQTTSGVTIDGGRGVGRVTKPGLDQPVGAAAINHVPRQMIADAAQKAAAACGYRGGLRVVISLPAGVALAAKTFNPQLGIVGGVSILGTSGIVMPQSVQALLDTIGVQLRMHRAEGAQSVVLSPGNYSKEFLPKLYELYPGLKAVPQVTCANFIGDSLDLAAQAGYQNVLVLSHIGKLVKVAGGILNTHSRFGDCRAELFTAHAALAGASQETARALMEARTTDACIAILDGAGLRAPVLQSLLHAIQRQLSRRAAGRCAVGAATFIAQYGFLGATEEGQRLLEMLGPEARS